LKEQKSEDGAQPPSDIVFEVGRNDERILALSVSAEGCGAYCENYTMTFNFDVATGRHVIATELFTPAGSAALLKQLDASRLARIKTEIATLRRDAKAAEKEAAKATTKGATTATDTHIDDAIDMYEQCVAGRTNPENAKYRNLASDGMKIGKDAITFIGSRCSNHASRALDEVGELSNTILLKDYAPHLSAYGKSLLMGDAKTVSAAGPFEQVLVGRIGQAPITIRVGARHTDDSLSATYYYDKYRMPIRLFGKVKGNELVMDESDRQGKVVAVIRATISGDSLNGNWNGNGKQIAFEAGP
jgi:hypothetical protein